LRGMLQPSLGQMGAVDLADTEQLPVVFSCFTREALGLHMVFSADLQRIADYWQPMVVGANREIWGRLNQLVKRQRDFANASRRLIESIEFSGVESPAGLTIAGADPDEGGCATDQESDKFSFEKDDDNDQTLTVSMREEPDDDSDAISAESTENGEDDIASVNRDSPVNVDSQTGSESIGSDKGKYRAYTTAQDEVVDANTYCSASDLAELREALDLHLQRHSRLVGKLSGKLQRVLMTQQQRRWVFDLEEGALDSARLARVVADPTVALSFKRESDMLFKDTIVTLLVDNSKSMLGKPIAIAAACSDILSQTLERCGVSVEILGFTTTELHGGEQYDEWKREGAEQNPGRLNGLRHIVYKAADTPYRRARRGFGLMLHKDLLKQNIDGEALLWAYKRLQRRPERRKILLVISDGAPVDTSTITANDKNLLADHLHQVISTIECRRDVELSAIGIGHDVTNYYSNAMTILDARDLGRSMLARLGPLFSSQV